MKMYGEDLAPWCGRKRYWDWYVYTTMKCFFNKQKNVATPC